MPHPTRGRRGGALRRQLAIGVLIVLLLAGAAVWAVARRAGPAAGGMRGADPASRELVALGRQVYATRCASCHGADLAGEPGWRQPRPNGTLRAPPLDATGPSWRRTDQQLFAIVRDGGQATAPPGAISAMPAFGASLGDERIWAVLAYIRSAWPPDIQ